MLKAVLKYYAQTDELVQVFEIQLFLRGRLGLAERDRMRVDIIINDRFKNKQKKKIERERINISYISNKTSEC